MKAIWQSLSRPAVQTNEASSAAIRMMWLLAQTNKKLNKIKIKTTVMCNNLSKTPYCVNSIQDVT